MLENEIFYSENCGLSMVHVYTVENYSTFKVKVKSGEFCGASSFCMSIEKIKNTLDILSGMHNKLEGNCVLNDSDSDAFILFEMQNTGKTSVSGQIGGSHESHSMRFACMMDQTAIANLLKTLCSAIKR